MKTVPLVVFSDLDGTLLDHDTYGWSAAKPALDALARLDVPVVLASSKTAVELQVIQAQMGLADYPAIVENGAGVLGGDSVPVYDDLRAALEGLSLELRRPFKGFGDMTLAELIACTGLSDPAARLARQRQFSEPGLWSGSQSQQAAFEDALRAQGITARSGGRFLTLSYGKSKADQMGQILAHYSPRHSVALGDAPNDTEMLQSADIGIVIANPHRAPLPPLEGEAEGRIRRSAEPGPSGWNAEIIGLLRRLNLLNG